MPSPARDAHRVDGRVVVDWLAVPAAKVDVGIDDRRWWRGRRRRYIGNDRDLASREVRKRAAPLAASDILKPPSWSSR